MPHDMNGIKLHLGDVVTIQAIIREIHTTERFCNLLTLETSQLSAFGDHRSLITLNASQVKREGDESH